MTEREVKCPHCKRYFYVKERKQTKKDNFPSLIPSIRIKNMGGGGWVGTILSLILLAVLLNTFLQAGG